jgi:hypothetical protein
MTMALSRWIGRMFKPDAERDRWEQARQARHAHRNRQNALSLETELARQDADYLESQVRYLTATGPGWRNDEYDPGPNAVRDQHPPDGGDAGMGAP